MSKNCSELMKQFADRTASNAEKLEYAQCVQKTVQVSSCNNTYNEPLLFAFIFCVITLVAFAIGRHVKKTNQANPGTND